MNTQSWIGQNDFNKQVRNNSMDFGSQNENQIENGRWGGRKTGDIGKCALMTVIYSMTETQPWSIL